MKKIYYSWQDIENQTQEILRQLQRDAWRPDYVVGLTRGGLIPANLISQYLEVRMETLNVSLRDNNSQPESNLWMAEDAFGYVPAQGGYRQPDEATSDPALRKNILIVDDINDSGATLNWIREDWPSGCLPNDPAWNEIWGHNVRVATLVDNEASGSQIPISYSAIDLNKAEDNCWIVFPWEDWWR
jgi:hypoxanthine phosphoribosyltransferase